MSGILTLALSTCVMLAVFVAVLIGEKRYAKRTKDFFARTNPQIDELAKRTQQKYRQRYGKDPTGSFTAYPFRKASGGKG